MPEAPARVRRVDLGGLGFRYWELGSTDATRVLLLHALGRDADDWLAVGRALCDRWRVIALDQRGHGGSARPGAYGFELMRDDLAALVDALSLGRIGMIGHSMGGVVAYLYAEAHPRARVAARRRGHAAAVPRQPARARRGPGRLAHAVDPALERQVLGLAEVALTCSTCPRGQARCSRAGRGSG